MKANLIVDNMVIAYSRAQQEKALQRTRPPSTPLATAAKSNQVSKLTTTRDRIGLESNSTIVIQ